MTRQEQIEKDRQEIRKAIEAMRYLHDRFSTEPTRFCLFFGSNASNLALYTDVQNGLAAMLDRTEMEIGN